MATSFYLPRFTWLHRRLRRGWLRPASVESEEIREILAEYGLSLTNMPTLPAAPGRGSSLIVPTSRGKAVLKVYSASRPLPGIVHEHSILAHLAKSAFPVPALHRTRTGETFVHRQDATYALFHFVEGYIHYHQYYVPPRRLRQFLSAAGGTLARLHRQLQGFVPEGQNLDGFKSLTGDRWHTVEWYSQKLDFCIEETSPLNTGQGQPSAVLDTLLQRADWLRARFHQLYDLLTTAAPPRMLIHGDYGPSNLLFKPDESPIVLDFEFACLDWRIVDLAKAFHRFAHGRFGFSSHKMESFLCAYQDQAHYPLDRAELELVPAVWQYLALRRLILCWSGYCSNHDSRWLSKLQNCLWRINGTDDLRDQFLAYLAARQVPNCDPLSDDVARSAEKVHIFSSGLSEQVPADCEGE